jgi:hypothetical protein
MLLDQNETSSDVTVPALPETVWFKLCGQGWRVQRGVLAFFGLEKVCGREAGRRRRTGTIIEIRQVKYLNNIFEQGSPVH